MVKEFCPASCQTHPHAVVSCGVVCTLEEQKPHPLAKGVDTWEGGGGREILALMNYGICGYIHLRKIKIVLSTSLTHTLLSSPQPTGWFVVTKMTMIHAQITYNLSYEYIIQKFHCTLRTRHPLKIKPPTFQFVCVCVCTCACCMVHISRVDLSSCSSRKTFSPNPDPSKMQVCPS